MPHSVYRNIHPLMQLCLDTEQSQRMGHDADSTSLSDSTTQATGHTAGPWRIASNGFGAEGVHYVLGAEQRNTIGDEIAVLYHGGDADARLIAAAPDLLASLKVAVELMEGADFEDPNDEAGFQSLTDARAAIATAEGRTA